VRVRVQQVVRQVQWKCVRGSAQRAACSVCVDRWQYRAGGGGHGYMRWAKQVTGRGR